ncbi:unnamed protein product, partial [Tilletia controversa]
MSASTFITLERMLKREGGLVDGKRIKAREQSAIFLYINRFAASTRQAADMFGHSATSIGTAFKSILKALLTPEIYNRQVSMSSASDIHVRIAMSTDLFPFFKNVAGAIDGS